MPEKRCENCEFWDSTTKNHEDKIVAQRVFGWDDTVTGTEYNVRCPCRQSPTIEWKFRDDWCGKFSPREENDFITESGPAACGCQVCSAERKAKDNA